MLIDAVGETTGVPLVLNYTPEGAPAIGYAPTLRMPYPLELFGRGRRKQACGGCERSDEPALNQALYLLTDADITDRVSVSKGRLRVLKTNDDDRVVVEELYLAALSRFPDDDEMKETLAYKEDCASRDEWLEDVLWSLLNVREFLFQH